MQLYPEPNVAGLNNNYVVNRNNTDDTHAFDVRVDHNFSSNDRFFARYSFSDNHKVRPSPFDGDGDGGGFNEGDETVGVNGLAASHTHMFSSTLINEARFGLSREHTNRLQPNGDDTSDLPGKYGILGIPQIEGNGGLPLLSPATASPQLGHSGWVVSERFSNTLQFSDNLTKVYKSHTFKTGYIVPGHLLRLDPAAVRARRVLLGRPLHVGCQRDRQQHGAGAFPAARRFPSTVPGGVDFSAACTRSASRRSATSMRSRPTTGRTARTAGASSSKLTLNYGLRWDWFSREQEREAEQANMVPGPPSRYLIPAEWRDQPLSPSFVTNLARDGIELVYTDEFGSGLGKMPKNNFAPRLDAAYQFGEKYVLRSGYGLFYGAFENRGGNPSLGYNYPFQFTLIYQVAERRRAHPAADGSLATLDARTRIPLDPLNVNANGLNAARRRVRLQDAEVSQLQRDAADRAGGTARASKSAMSGRGAATSRRSPA